MHSASPITEYEPSSQGICRSSVVRGQRKPAGQAVHAAAPPVLKLPGKHRVFSAASVMLGHCEPGGQDVQMAAPSPANSPGRQGIGAVDVEGQRWPAGHALQLVAPARLYVVNRHGTGCCEVVAHREPAGQVTQAAPSLTYSPLEQLTGDAAGLLQAAPFGQGTHCSETGVGVYVPASVIKAAKSGERAAGHM